MKQSVEAWLQADEAELAELSDFYIASRYPIDAGSPSLEAPSRETAQRLRSAARSIHDPAVTVLTEHEPSVSGDETS
jgi:HEPN domain-containing protein